MVKAHKNWSVTITKVQNGFVVDSNDETININLFEEKKYPIYETDNINKKDLVCMREILNFVRDYFAYSPNKNDKYRLKIKIEKNKLKNEK